MEAHPRTQTRPRTLGKRMGAELSAILVCRCSETLSGLRGAVLPSRLMKSREDRVACEIIPAGRLKREQSPREQRAPLMSSGCQKLGGAFRSPLETDRAPDPPGGWQTLKWPGFSLKWLVNDATT